jgi:hypothetical protein
MKHYLVTGTPPPPGTPGQWDLLIKGAEARIAAAWAAHRDEVMAAARPEKPAAWYWFAAPPGQRRPVGELDAHDTQDENER